MYEQSVHHTDKQPASVAGGGSGGVVAHGLGKRFGDMWALRDLDLDVAPGSVLGLLGHNGAGKTTAIRILTTLSIPTAGTATVAGLDVVGQAAAVRRRIGVASQQATVDGLLDARLNLEMVGRLHHLGKAAARRRADELLERLDLTDAANRLVKTFSGGMRRRLDLAACLVASPEVLFLDEPTTGLDPRSRNDLWDMLRELVRDGTTVLLTTQYLEEADRLADDIVVLDHGVAVAHGTPSELKSQIGNDRLDVKVSRVGELSMAADVLRGYSTKPSTFDEDLLTVSIALKDGTRLIDVVRTLDDAGVDAVDMNRRQATLDDVFLTLTSPTRDASNASGLDSESGPDGHTTELSPELSPEGASV